MKKESSSKIEVLTTIKMCRMSIVAPVDTMGASVVPSTDLNIRKFQILVKLILSIQSKDEVTHRVFHYLNNEIDTITPENILKINNLETMIKGINFYRRKSTTIKEVSRVVVNDGSILDDVIRLKRISGIGNKILKIYSKTALEIDIGVGVDLHVHRILNRLGIVETKNAIETDKVFSYKEYSDIEDLNRILVGFGQVICKAVPLCSQCVVKDECKFNNSR
ncbi:NTH [Enterospora canceri]|uniref:NTH n=1 Tax=Enterospora canceri TaxID=1081671 RepID=A0A1Y1S9L1_9MICR|nr:NTH [Enterospora canceri]